MKPKRIRVARSAGPSSPSVSPVINNYMGRKRIRRKVFTLLLVVVTTSQAAEPWTLPWWNSKQDANLVALEAKGQGWSALAARSFRSPWSIGT